MSMVSAFLVEAAYRPEGLGAQIVLDLAGILAGDVRRNAELDEEVRKDLVPGVDLLGDLHSGGGEGDKSVVVHGDVAVLAESLGRVADGWLCNAEKIGDVDRADIPNPAFLFLHEDSFQIILSRFE